MSTIAIVFSAIFIALVVIQAGIIIAHNSTMHRSQSADSELVDWPKIAVLMPMRGADPYLESAIKSVLSQDYADFDVHIIVDHESDPAMEKVSDLIAKLAPDNVTLSVLTHRPKNCSLICSTICQFVRSLDPTIELIAICAADMIVPRNWLRTAANVMQDATVGTTIGSRWYMPATSRLGTLVRYIWNSAANVSMWWYEAPWSGTMILRVEDIKRLGILDKWSQSMTEDMTVVEPLKKAGLTLKYTPHLFVVNREDISLRDNFRFITRQLILTRMYHPQGLRLVLHFFPMSVAGIVAVPFFAALLARDSLFGALCVGFSLLLSGLVLLSCLVWKEWSVRRLMKRRNEPTTNVSALQLIKLPFALIISQFQYMLSVVAVLTARVVIWRGITYRIRDNNEVEMVEYRPYSAVNGPTNQSESI